MKKLLCLLLSFIVIFTAACAAEPTPTTETTLAPTETTVLATETSAPDEGSFADYQAPMAAVSFPTVTDARTDEDGNMISRYLYPEFSVSLPDADVAEAVMLDLLNRVDSTVAAAETMHAAAQSASAAEGFQPYLYEVRYNVRRLDQNILSFFSTETYFDGSPRSLQSAHSVSYDLSTGNVLNLKAIMQEDYSADILAELIVEGLSDRANSLFEDYDATVKALFSTNVPVENWYFSSEGLCFFFAPYEIAPVSMGDVIATIPYEKLSGMLNEQFFPAETLSYNGQLEVKHVTGDLVSATEAYEQFSELTFEAGKEQYLLTVCGSVSDLRIYTAAEEGNNTMVYAAAGLGSTDCLLIETDSSIGKLIIEYVLDGAPAISTLTLDEAGEPTLN